MNALRCAGRTNRPTDNGDQTSMGNGMSRAQIGELQQHRSGPGYFNGGEHSGPAGRMGGYSTGPATSNSGSMMQGYSGPEIPGQPNGTPENHTGEMPMAPAGADPQSMPAR